MDESGRFVKPELILFLRGMLTLTWHRWRAQFKRQIKHFHQAQAVLKEQERG